ncbi:hypothetical protein H8E88_10260 [candidate division KSB1 bacterium]|nr:hypothetical protein [candidate division KSB1 bacterium]
MGMTNPYCDTTTDLQYIFSSIEKFSGLETIVTFTATSGQDKTFDKRNTGYVGIVYEDGVALTEKTSIATVQATASTYWYDSTNDILYVHCSDDADPDTHTITVAAEDWNTLKTFMSERAFQQLEGMLDKKYPNPLPFAAEQYNSKNYDADIVEAAARLTCINIIRHRDPDNPLIKTLQDLVWNVKEEKGVIWEYSKGLRTFSFECTADQFNGNIKLISRDAASTGLIFLAGTGDRSNLEKISIKIVTGGAVGTATWKYSRDNQTTWSGTINSSLQYIYLTNNLYMKFSGTFVTDDEWEVNIAGDPEMLTSPGIRSIKLRRN